jgi:hypothetical protein
MEEVQNQQLFSLNIEPITKSHLRETAKWAKFLSIAGIVFLSLATLAVLLSLTIMPRMAKFTMNGVEQEEFTAGMRISFFLVMVIVFAIAFFPMLFMLQFANQMKTALYSNNQELLNSSFQNLKKYFRYIGIIMIIVLAFYALAFVIVALGAFAAS